MNHRRNSPGDPMVTIRRMTHEDIEETIVTVVASFEDAWNRYERDYYPRKALDFDVSKATPDYFEKRIQEPNDFLRSRFRRNPARQRKGRRPCPSWNHMHSPITSGQRLGQSPT
jgi:ribosomal protein S18 acetylase RimI-like enzyme